MTRKGTVVYKNIEDLLISVRYGHRNHGEECERCATNADALEAYIRMLEGALKQARERIPENTASR